MRRVTIIPRGRALGVTVQTPVADRYGYSVRYLRGRIMGALGGRAAEELVYDDVTTGAESDIEQATEVARQMVGRWGMSPAIGPVSVLPPGGQERSFGPDGVAPATRQLVDEEVRRLVDRCYADALETLRANRERLDRLARALLEHETLEEVDAYAAVGLPRGGTPATIVSTPAIDGDPLLRDRVPRWRQHRFAERSLRAEVCRSGPLRGLRLRCCRVCLRHDTPSPESACGIGQLVVGGHRRVLSPVESCSPGNAFAPVAAAGGHPGRTTRTGSAYQKQPARTAARDGPWCDVVRCPATVI